MDFSPPPIPPAPADAGLTASLKHLFSASGRYAGARLKLAAVEAKSAAGALAKPVILFGAAAVVALTGLVMLLTAAVIFVGDQWLQGNYAASCGIFGGVFLLAGWICYRCASGSLKHQEYFPVTKAELNRDKQWL